MTLIELRQLSEQVRRLYESEGPQFGDFQKSTGLHCLPECGACCNHPEVSTSVAEMLPLAFVLYDRGIGHSFYDELRLLEPSAPCVLYKPTSQDKSLGFCSEYQHRAVICRSFGACAVKNKIGEKVLSLCQHIKKSTQVNLENISLSQAPLIENFASSVRSLDADTNIYPINLALRFALEKVLTAANYENESSRI
jgi:uncharacterized protein